MSVQKNDTSVALTVLLVEDELDLLELVEEAFHEENFRVLCSKNGLEALGIIATNKIDLVVSDIKMPGMSGLELRQKSRTLTEQDPKLWVALTAHVDAERSQTDLSDFTEHFFKPYSPRLLAKLCRKLISSGYTFDRR